MDVGGTLLDLACARIAIIPAGPHLPDHRFDELTAHLVSLREIPVSALPRRAAVPKPTTSATFTAMPAALRAANNGSNPGSATPSSAHSTSTLPRSRSTSRDFGRTPLHSTVSSASARALDSASLASSMSAARAAARAPAVATRAPTSAPVSPRRAPDLDLARAEVDASFRMRYDVVYRDPAGALIMRPLSEWDAFHSCKIWGVFGVVDCTASAANEDTEQRVKDASRDFTTVLTQFRDACVRRLIVFTHPDAQHNAPFVLNADPDPFKDVPSAPAFSVGYVPVRARQEDTRLEVRAQVVHFAGLLLNALDRECWKRRDIPSHELVSPIDEKQSADRQGKLVKRRAGRLDKVLGDSLLLMGSPSEALVKYNSSIERSKNGSDRLWLAGAMEGWAAAHVLTQVGGGKQVTDRALTDSLIETYAEIYKLYQKKRVIEPETTAAMRLAEFLGRWTNRRKDALEAAQHAALVGANLRTQKRAALWEALARFSDRMGCRRKASLYLFQLAQLSASQSMWSSAVTLSVACERQLTVKNRKPWASLSRMVLLIAARFAENSGDLSTAARLFVEALVTSPTLPTNKRDGDQSILQSLAKTQVPAFLPAANGVVHLAEIRPLHIEGLSIRKIKDSAEPRKTESASKDGPFIYNPFEAKKRAKAAASKLRAVTWVCDEPATVRVHLRSNVAADLNTEIISVLLSERKPAELAKSESSSSDEQEEGANTGQVSSSGEDENAAAEHAREVREQLDLSGVLAKTVSEHITLHPEKDKSDSNIKHITVVPRKTGPLFVRGVLLKLFSGALVLLGVDTPPDPELPPVNVVESLPRVSISTHRLEGDPIDHIGSRTALSIFDGERRSFRVVLKNTGTDRIKSVKTKVSCEQPDILAVMTAGLSDEDALAKLENNGGELSFTVELVGKHTRRTNVRRVTSMQPVEESPSVEASISVAVEYEGTTTAGTIRESSAVIDVICKAAVELGRLTILSNPTSDGADAGVSELTHCLALDVTNNLSVPATVTLSQDGVTLPDAASNGGGENKSKFDSAGESKPDTSIDSANTGDEANGKLRSSKGEVWPNGFSSEDCLIEHSASARLMCNIHKSTITQLRNFLCGMDISGGDGDSVERNPATKAIFRVAWILPAMGRHGTLDVSMADLQRSLSRGRARRGPRGPTGAFTRNPVQAEMGVSLVQACGSDARKSGNLRAARNAIAVGSFADVVVQIRNVCDFPLHAGTALDIDLVHRDERGVSRAVARAVIVGATRRVAVGALTPQCGCVTHAIRARVASTGCFQVVATLYDADAGDKGADDGPGVSTDTTPSADLSHDHVPPRLSLGNGTPEKGGGTPAARMSTGSRGNGSGASSRPTSVGSSPAVLALPGRGAQAEETGGRTIYPTTVDSYDGPTSPTRRRAGVMAYATLNLLAVQENEALV